MNERETEEQQHLLPSHAADISSPPPAFRTFWPFKGGTVSTPYLFLAFVSGILVCLLPQYALSNTPCPSPVSSTDNYAHALAPPYVGSTEVHNWPPPSPTNDVSTLFPTNVGHAGATPTGAEPALVLTAPSYPIHTGAAQLVLPSALHAGGESKKGFDLFKKWGNLSPWYSVQRGRFGVDSDPGAPDGCSVTGLHFLHRHGARYPTSWASYGGPASLARRLNEAAADWTAQGDLDFLNNWTYKLGEEGVFHPRHTSNSGLTFCSVDSFRKTATFRPWHLDPLEIWVPTPELHRRTSRVSHRVTVCPDTHATVTFIDTIFLH
ncbi:hypothetical protein BJY52DRAFT_1238865 [Lactarius psammicola]|nr:hypothetical protein BJY52DRAFT_1238865 [Lactarius psammicola]